MIGAATALVAVVVAITAVAGPLADYCARAGADLTTNATYRDAVHAAGTTLRGAG